MNFGMCIFLPFWKFRIDFLFCLLILPLNIPKLLWHLCPLVNSLISLYKIKSCHFVYCSCCSWRQDYPNDSLRRHIQMSLWTIFGRSLGIIWEFLVEYCSCSFQKYVDILLLIFNHPLKQIISILYSTNLGHL